VCTGRRVEPHICKTGVETQNRQRYVVLLQVEQLGLSMSGTGTVGQLGISMPGTVTVGQLGISMPGTVTVGQLGISMPGTVTVLQLGISMPRTITVGQLGISMPRRVPVGQLGISMPRTLRVPIQPCTKRVPGVKRPVREAGHQRTSDAKVKNEWHYTSTHHMRYGVKSDSFTFSVFWTLCIFCLKTKTFSSCKTFVIDLDDRR
jgi:hypothetical protein